MNLAAAAGADLRIVAEVLQERRRQDQRWGEQNHPNGTGPTWLVDQFGSDGLEAPTDAATFTQRMREICDSAATSGEITWRAILIEEVAEAMAEEQPEGLRRELIQVAAVAVACIAKIDRANRAASTQEQRCPALAATVANTP